MKTNLHVLSATSAFFLFAACQQAEPPATSDRGVEVTSAALGASLTAFPLHLPRLGNAEVARRTGAFATTLLGQSLPASSFTAAVTAAAATPSGLSGVVADNPHVKFSHRPHLGGRSSSTRRSRGTSSPCPTSESRRRAASSPTLSSR